MTIGQRIKARREELEMSQDELAHRIGYKSRSSINKIELDHHSLKQSKIKAIAEALDTTPSYIMGWDDESSPAPAGLDESGYDLDAKEKALLTAFNELTEEGKDLSIEYTQMLGTQNKYKKFALPDAESVG